MNIIDTHADNSTVPHVDPLNTYSYTLTSKGRRLVEGTIEAVSMEAGLQAVKYRHKLITTKRGGFKVNALPTGVIVSILIKGTNRNL